MRSFISLDIYLLLSSQHYHLITIIFIHIQYHDKQKSVYYHDMCLLYYTLYLLSWSVYLEAHTTYSYER